MAAGPRNGYLALQTGGEVVEVINHARTAAYLENPDLAPQGFDICNVLDFGGCYNYNYTPCSDRGYIEFSGSTGSYLSTPNAAPLQIVGDITLIAKIAPDDWTPAAIKTILAKWTVAGNLRSYSLDMTTAGALSFRWSTTGTDSLVATSNANLSALEAGAALWVRVDFDADNGASGRTARFWTSFDGVAWGALGTAVTSATATTIVANTSILTIGALGSGTTQNFDGDILYAEVRDGSSTTATLAGTPVFTYNGPVDLLNTSVAATTFTATTGQTVTKNGAATIIVPVRETYSTPALDNAPWYSASWPESADALGFHIEEWTGLGDGHVKGSLRPVGGRGGGGRVGPLASEGRIMKLNVLLIARTEEAMQYLFDWLSSTLIGVCGGCGDDNLLYRRYCGNTATPMAGIGEMRRVRLIEGVAWETDPTTVATCVLRRVSFTLAAGDPCVYLPESTPAITSTTATLGTCFSAVFTGATRYPCRPSCSELVASCRASYGFEVTPLGAISPVVTLWNNTSNPSFPMRLVLYADPNEIGMTYGACGLPILAEVYVRSLPAGATFVWDVTGRSVWFKDPSTGGFVDGSGYLDANDPPIPRYSSVPCGDAWVVVEPGTLCIENVGGWEDVNTDVIYSSPAFPQATVTLQERVGCA